MHTIGNASLLSVRYMFTRSCCMQAQTQYIHFAPICIFESRSKHAVLLIRSVVSRRAETICYFDTSGVLWDDTLTNQHYIDNLFSTVTTLLFTCNDVVIPCVMYCRVMNHVHLKYQQLKIMNKKFK